MAFAGTGYSAGETAHKLRTLSALSGEEGFSYMVQILAKFCDIELEHGAETLKQSCADVAVLDFVAAGFGLVAASLRIPYLHISTSMHFDLTGQSPLCLFPWEYDSSADGLARNTRGLAQFARLYLPVISRLRAFAKLHGLDDAVRDKKFTGSELAVISQVPREFDFPEVGITPSFHYTGPFQQDEARPYIDFPWYRLTGEPIIYASMGTLQNGSERVFHMIAEASISQGRQLVLAIGNHVDASKLVYPSERVIVTRYAPQPEILKRAALCITHGGLNTVLESLSAGVPMVVIPVTNDQPGIAMRVVYTGSGTVVPLQELTVVKLRDSIENILNNQAYDRNARRLQASIQAVDGLSLAADIVERSFQNAIPQEPGTERDAGESSLSHNPLEGGGLVPLSSRR
jgi:MGT family glycosyltransferase